jgi:multiple sugar transport system permease protein
MGLESHSNSVQFSGSIMRRRSIAGVFRTVLGQLREVWKCRSDYLRIAPTLILFSIFIFGPAIWTVYVGFFDWQLHGGSEFIGLSNYGRMLSDEIFWLALKNTFVYTFGITALSVGLGFVAAILVNGLKGPVMYFTRAAIFLPTILSLIVTALIWRSFMEVEGLFERMFALVGIHTGAWLAEPQLASLAIIIVAVWQRMGYNMVFFLAGLQAIPQPFYEAAEVDGASEWQKFTHVTIPLLQRTTLFILVVNTVTNFLMFDLVYAMTGGGPMKATITLMVHIYNQAFRYIRYGYAGAMAVVFSAIAIMISVVQMYLLRGGEGAQY